MFGSVWSFTFARRTAKCLSLIPPAQAAGKWYLVGFATNTQWFVSHKASMKMGTAQFTPTAEGDLELSYSSLRYAEEEEEE